MFTLVSGLVGGVLIGCAAVLLLLANGRLAGISAIVGGLIMRTGGEVAWRLAFVVGLWWGAVFYWLARGKLFDVTIVASPAMMIVAGLLVGFGTRLAGGCTSGHGVCGIARLSVRSITATLIFMGTAIVTVYLVRHVAT